MKKTKITVLIATIILILCGVSFLPRVSGQGQKNSLVAGVAVLEAMVTDLYERVEDLEQGQVPPGTSFDVLHLNPLDDFPTNPSEGDLCVVWDDPYGVENYYLYCYLYGDWRLAASYVPPNPDPRQ